MIVIFRKTWAYLSINKYGISVTSQGVLVDMATILRPPSSATQVIDLAPRQSLMLTYLQAICHRDWRIFWVNLEKNLIVLVAPSFLALCVVWWG